VSGVVGQVVTRWLISGRVQGVGFRWFVARHAHAEDIVGWVRNLPDGRVEVVARGQDEALRTLEARLRAGPPSAAVSSVERADIPHDLVSCKTFEIR
jgi:acylphosphatase